MKQFETKVRGSPSVRAIVKVLPNRARICVGSVTSPNGRFSEIVSTEEARALYSALGNYLAHVDNAGVAIDG